MAIFTAAGCRFSVEVQTFLPWRLAGYPETTSRRAQTMASRWLSNARPNWVGRVLRFRIRIDCGLIGTGPYSD